jgi:hypothetical protein
MRENFCQLNIRQGINNQNIQGAQTTKLSKNQRPNEEMSRTLSKEEVQMAKNT